MKKSLLLIVCFAAIGSLYAQPGKTPVTKTPVSQLKTLTDSASYAVGLSVANFYKQQGITKLNTGLVSKAISDILAGKKPLLDDAASNTVLNNYMMMLQAQKSKPRIDSGTAFLAKNKLKKGVITTPSGLQYEIITEGTGIKPALIDTFVCNYRGTLLNGTEFDASANRGTPLVMPVTGVIKGWTEGLQLMNVGSKYKFYIPYTLGYGPSDYGPIPGGSLLIFDVELLDVRKGPAQ